MRTTILATMLRWLAVVLVLRVLYTILANYPDYFPPNFDSLFLQGRETSFSGSYVPAFYLHIFVGPLVLFNALILMSEHIRRHYGGLHRILGRIQVAVLLLFLLPSSAWMSRHAYGGWPAGVSFFLLSLATAGCAIAGVVEARRHRYAHHQRWMTRCFLLLCSAVALRLISGTAGLIGVSDPETAYILAAWSSWLVPLGVYEVFARWSTLAPAPAEHAMDLTESAHA